MFGLSKNKKAKAEEFKDIANHCARLKDEILILIEEDENLSEAQFEDAKRSLEFYEKTKREIVAIKNDANLKPRDKLNSLAIYKGKIEEIKMDLENTKEMLEKKWCKKTTEEALY